MTCRLLLILSHFVKVVFVELAHKAGEVAVLEVFREDGFGKFLVLRADDVYQPGPRAMRSWDNTPLEPQNYPYHLPIGQSGCTMDPRAF